MKKILFYSSILLAVALWSCVSEEPFAKDGEGTLRMNMVVSSEITRAEADADASLAASCKLLISKVEKGLLYKYDGVGQVPERLVLSTGSYVAEGYAGDSVSASWDKKFYKGRREFQIQSGSETQVELVCGIANVVAAIDSETIDPDLIKNWKLTVGHSRAQLEFTQANIDDRAYFMMPSADWNAADGSDVGSLHWTITGTDGNGTAFEPVSGVVEHVKPAHQYTFNVLLGSADSETVGGGFIQVEVDETDLERYDNIMIFGAPVIVMLPAGSDIDAPVSFAPGEYPSESLELGIKAHEDISSLSVEFSSAENFGVDYAAYDLLGMSGEIGDALLADGMSMSLPQPENVDENVYVTRCLTLTKAMLDRLPEGKHSLKISARDQAGKTTDKVVEFLVSDAKVMVGDVTEARVRSYSAQIPVTIADSEVTNPGLRYREISTRAADDEWTEVRAVNGIVTLTNLKPSTRYELQAIADGYVNEMSEFFETEGQFSIPNASFEEWGSYSARTLLGTKNVTFPGLGSEPTFWDSGNEGAATANLTLTDKSTDMVHSGTYSARLASASAMGVLAAGNIFAGDYEKTDGANGVLSFGRLFDGTHPAALKLFANYRPGTVNLIKDGNEKYIGITKGDNDHGQIYVALTTEAVDIRTNPNDRKLFDAEASYVIAYGQITWTDNFGADGQLEEVEIKLNYKKGKENDKPTHLVIVASASKFGDYFSGSSSSVMYLDDLELVYE